MTECDGEVGLICGVTECDGVCGGEVDGVTECDGECGECGGGLVSCGGGDGERVRPDGVNDKWVICWEDGELVGQTVSGIEVTRIVAYL